MNTVNAASVNHPPDPIRRRPVEVPAPQDVDEMPFRKGPAELPADRPDWFERRPGKLPEVGDIFPPEVPVVPGQDVVALPEAPFTPRVG